LPSWQGAARQNLPACASETGQTHRARSRVTGAFRSWLAPTTIGTPLADFTARGGNRKRPAAMRTRFLRLRRRNDKNTSHAILKSCLSDGACGGIWNGMALEKRCHLASEHGHPPANLPNRFGGQQKSEELNIMKGSAFIVGESRRVSDADRRT